MGGLPRCAGIVRQQERKLPLSARRDGEPRPERCAARSGSDTIRRGLMRDAGEFETGDFALFGLEGDRSGEQATIELGQHHCMAWSDWESPRGESRQASRLDPANTTCRIGAPAASRGDGASSSRAEKAVALSTICGLNSRKIDATKLPVSRSLRLAT